MGREPGKDAHFTTSPAGPGGPGSPRKLPIPRNLPEVPGPLRQPKKNGQTRGLPVSRRYTPRLAYRESLAYFTVTSRMMYCPVMSRIAG